MFTFAPLIGLVVLLLPVAEGLKRQEFLTLIASGFLLAGWLLYRRRALRQIEIAASLAYSSVAVMALDLLSGSPVSPFSSFQIWPVVCGALFLPRLGLAVLVLLGISGAAASILSYDQSGDAMIRWAVLSSSMLVVTVIVRRIGHQIREQLSRLETQSRTDGLTGMLNRRAFDEILARECQLVARGGDSFALGLLDVDHFKEINDARGHGGGDAVLCSVAAALRGRLRATDDLFRIGGDEFAVILRDCDIAHASRALRDALELMTVISHGVTLSIGVASCPEHGVEPESLLRAADAALYGAKACGRANLQVAVDGAQVASAGPQPGAGEVAR